jgi:predicted site-specific integrase-resolvase
MTCEEVADFLRIEKDTLAKWRETGRVDLPFVKLGLKEIRYRYGDIVAFIEKRMAVNTVAARGLDGRA